MASLEITLDKPLVTHEGPVSVLKLKDPPGLALFTIGYPFKTEVETVTENGKPVQKLRLLPIKEIVYEYLKAMAPYDMGVMAGLSPPDQIKVQGTILDLFSPENPTKPD